MQFGICAPAERAEAMHRAGFDFLELPLSAVRAWEEREVRETAARLRDAGMPALAFNGLLAPGLRICGGPREEAALDEYFDGLFDRAAALGGALVVFGSGAARRIPDELPREAGEARVEAFARRLARLAARSGLRVVIEPLNRAECNVLTRADEALALAQRIGDPALGVLVDIYHLYHEEEPLADVEALGSALWHVHMAQPVNRGICAPDDGFDYRPFAAALRRIGYDGGVSLECANPMPDAHQLEECLKVLRSLAE